MRHKFLIFLLCFLSGALMLPAMAPWNLWPFVFAGFSAFYLLLSRMQTKRSAFLCGWVFGFGYFSCGLWWIANALLVPGNPFSWVWPLAIAGLPALLAFFPALAALAVKKFAAHRTLKGFLFFAAAMAASEWLRGHIFTGFPWNLYGYAWGGWDAMMQNAAWGGPYFLTILTVGWAALPGFLYLSNISRQQKIITAGIALLLFISCTLYGHLRLTNAATSTNGAVHLLIVQPNIGQGEKWEAGNAMENLLHLTLLSAAPQGEGPGNTTLIVWPETAITADALASPQARTVLAAPLETYKGNVYLLTGMLRFGSENGREIYFNSATALDRDLKIVAAYDKSHLVPFGEYVPFGDILSIAPFVRFDGFTEGNGPSTLNLPGLPGFSPLICYEVIFPHAVTDRKTRPAFVVNITNDAWYGDSPGPRQHFMQTRFRAVEEGLPVVRAANTGISGVIDPYGRTMGSIALGTRGTLHISLPAPLQPTLYSLAGDTPFLVLTVLLLIFPLKRRGS